jgi:hypothetical protein
MGFEWFDDGETSISMDELLGDRCPVCGRECKRGRFPDKEWLHDEGVARHEAGDHADCDPTGVGCEVQRENPNLRRFTE